MPIAFTAGRLFDGSQWLLQQALVFDQGELIAVLPQEALPPGCAVAANLPVLAPALIDVQVYGAAGKLFSVHPTMETLALMDASFGASGTALFQPTIATNTARVMRQAIEAVKAYKAAGGKSVHGLHLEGPWLNPEKSGAHVKEWMHAPSINEVAELLETAEGSVTMVTLAPEICSKEVVKRLLDAGVVVSAGHSSLSCAEALNWFDSGINAVTHLYNAMSPLHHRQPGLVGATLLHNRVQSSIIPDGFHVDFAAIQLAHRQMGARLFAITDAVTETIEGPYRHQAEGGYYSCNGTLSGSAISMFQAYRNLVEQAAIPSEEALRMCSLYPARVLGVDTRYGRIGKGFAPVFLAMNEAETEAWLVSAPPSS